MTQQNPHDVEAFGSTCPDPPEVTTCLKSLGFDLVFQMAAQPCYPIPTLPAQYHYEHADGTQVIFLAGKDYVGDRIQLPSHQSRWWVYPGSRIETYQRVCEHLASQYLLLFLIDGSYQLQKESA